MRCPNCNEYIEEDELFCTECGCPVQRKGTTRRTGRNMIGAIVSLFLIVIVVCAAGIFWLNKKESKQEEVIEKESAENVQNENEEEQPIEKDYFDIEDEEETTVYEQPEEVYESNDDTSNEYIIADSNTRYLTNQDVEGMTLQQLNYARNEIYARHGRRFKSGELQNYFDSKSWYNGLYEPSEFDEKYSSKALSECEKKNAEFLKSKELEISADGYQLDVN